MLSSAPPKPSPLNSGTSADSETSVTQREQDFRALFEVSSVGMAQADASGHFLRVNPALCVMLGYNAQELLNRTIFDVAHPEDRTATNEGFARLQQGLDASYSVEKRYLRKDGTVLWVHVTANAIRSAPNQQWRAAAVIQDISPRKEAEEAQRAISERYEQQVRLFDSVASTTPDFVYLFDPVGRFQYANRRLLQVWGLELEQVIGKTCRELGYEQWHHDMHMREIAQVIATRREIKGQVPFRAPLTGIFGVYEYIFTPVMAPDGRVEFVAGTTRDVTERTRIEQALRESEVRYRELFSSMTEGFCVLEKTDSSPPGAIDFRLVVINPAFEKQSGLPDALGKTLRQLVPAPDVDHWIEVYDRVASSGEPIRFEREFVSQSRILEVYAYRVGEPDKRQVGVLFHDITKRRQVEDSLRRQLRLTETIAQGAGEALFLMDAQGCTTFLNPAAEAMFGWKLDEIRGRPLHDVIHFKHPDGKHFPMSACPLGKVMTAGIAVSGHEDIFYARDGHPVYVRCSNAPVTENGRITGAVLVVADITESRHAEEKLRRNHDTFYHLIQNNPFGIYLVDSDFRLRQISAGARKVFGSIDPLIGRDFAEVLRAVWSEPFATEAIARFRHTLETGEPFASPRTVEHRQDVDIVEAYDWRIERITLPDGRFGVVCYFYDLTERQRWELALSQSEERFQIAARATNDIIWDWDLSTNTVWWNDAPQRILGYGPGQISHHVDWWKERLHPDDKVRVLDSLQAVIPSRTNSWRAEYRFRRADGSYAEVLDRAYVMRDEQQKATRMIGAMQDLTERKQAERALADAQRALSRHAAELERTVEDRTEKLRATISELQALSYSISHDMRAPLRAMQGFSQALLDDYGPKLDTDARLYLDRISSASQRLDSLIQDILLFTKVSREPIVLKPLQLEPLLREILRVYHPNQEQLVSIRTPLPLVLGHDAFLSQIFSNLLTNALKFTAPGTQPNVRITSDDLGECVRIWVEDKGIGIAPEHFSRLFQVFGRVHSDEEYPGTGIGLAIVKKAAERLGGSVGVESTPGQGSRFWFTLRKADGSQIG